MKNYSFRIIIEPDLPTGYHGFVPLLKGVHTCGKTIEEVKKNLKEAVRCHIQGVSKRQTAHSSRGGGIRIDSNFYQQRT